MQWQKRNFPSEAVFRVYIAIGALRKAAAEYVEHMDHVVSWVGGLLMYPFQPFLMPMESHASCCLLSSEASRVHCQI